MKYAEAAEEAQHEWSPSMRREWIEMRVFRLNFQRLIRSPSMRREWIEIASSDQNIYGTCVSLHAELVD